MSKFVSLCVKHTVQLFPFRAKPKGWLLVLAHQHTHSHTLIRQWSWIQEQSVSLILCWSQQNWLEDDIHNNFMAPNIRTQRLWIRRYKKGSPTYPKKASTSSQREKNGRLHESLERHRHIFPPDSRRTTPKAPVYIPKGRCGRFA